MAKYYAVKKGRTPGIYNSWADCQKQTNGFSGAVFKSFNTEEEALHYLNGETIKKEINLSVDQQNALNIMLSGKNVFLTGKAGTGKSYLISHFIKEAKKRNKKILVCAPTGIAAINIGGVTIHRCFQAKLEPLINPVIESVPKAIRYANVIIVDEISMCRIDLFEYMIEVIKKAKRKIQLIVAGDFFQLPPVTTDNDLEILKQFYPNYNKGFAFESKKWDECQFTTVNLTTIMRQSDKEFIKYLNMIRIGNKDGLDYFNQVHHHKFKNGITLSAYNKTVTTINQNELNKLSSPLETYQAKIFGEVKPSDKPTEDILQLKIGARVMILINEPILFRYQNGSLGTVTKLSKDSATVRLDQNDMEFEFKYYEWGIFKYTVKERKVNENTQHYIVQEKIGSFVQLPLRLSYAITIHKSQGQTFDHVNLIPHSFDCGQLYVALSRVKSIQGLHLIHQMKTEDLICNDHVKNFYHIKEIDEHKIFEKLGKDIYNLDPSLINSLPEEIKILINQTRKQLSDSQ